MYMSSVPASVASSPPPTEPDALKIEDDEDDTPLEDAEFAIRINKLERTLKKSELYARRIKEWMDEARKKKRLKSDQSHHEGQEGASVDNNSNNDTSRPTKRSKLDQESGSGQAEEEEEGFRQPMLITGATMKDYQLEGVEWMMGLHMNGISGILADEMGLGKTLQTIAFNAFLRESHIYKPFLVVCPLSVMDNWKAEFNKFAPTIPVCIYHGNPTERAELRRTAMRPIREEDDEGGKDIVKKEEGSSEENESVIETPKARGKTTTRGRGGKRGRGRPRKVESTSTTMATRRSSRRTAKAQVESESEDEDEEDDEPQPSTSNGRRRRREKVSPSLISSSRASPSSTHSSPTKSKSSTRGKDGNPSKSTEATQPPESFPVIITTFDILIRDRPHLAKYHYSYIVVDEGHRLKNMDCKLMREIKKLNSDGRVVLTGTPLQNNLSELWSLLNFILPDIFADLDVFQEWFSIPKLQRSLSSERSNELISTLHAVLKPFLLRRLKADVLNSKDWFSEVNEEGNKDEKKGERGLPPKKEYVLWAPLSVDQREVYDHILAGGLRHFLINKDQSQNDKQKDGAPVDLGPRKMRSQTNGKKRKRFDDVDMDDDEYFEKLEADAREPSMEVEEDVKEIGDEELVEIERKQLLKTAVRQVNSLKLQNTVVQLRKTCLHPFLFHWPLSPRTRQPTTDAKELVQPSGKMMILARLLPELFARGHRVLIFSQFVTMLNILETWAEESQGWMVCRIDGSSSSQERKEQMELFQSHKDNGDTDPKKAPMLFLLSTRAGGLGINLTAADTVIFYDQDWNPQMDLQAQDRAHRIGQTRPVLIFRLVSAHTIEEKIMQRANDKRKLEAVVIAKGKFKAPTVTGTRGKKETMAELAASLMQLDGEKINVVSGADGEVVLSQADLDALLDRSPEVFRERVEGWSSSTSADGSAASKQKSAFAVYERKALEGEDDMLAGLMGTDVAE